MTLPSLNLGSADLVAGVRAVQQRVRKLARQLDSEMDLAARHQRSRALYGLLFELGLHQLEVPAEQGGLGLSARSRAMLLEALAMADAGAAMAMKTTASVVALLQSLERDELRDRLVAPCLADTTGAWLLSNAGTEPDHGSDAINFSSDTTLGTRLTRSGGGYVLQGEKWMMTNCGTAAAYVVLAQVTSGQAGRAFAIVPADAKGVSALPVSKRGLRTAAHGTVHFEGVRVPTGWVVTQGKMSAPTRRALHSGALAKLSVDLAAISLGVAQHSLEVVDAHVRERVQAGRPLLRHPTVALRLSEIHQAVSAARALTHEAANRIDEEDLDLALAAAARACAVEASRLACRQGLDLVGSPAVLEEHPLSKLTRDADTLAVPFGSPDLLRVLARSD